MDMSASNKKPKIGQRATRAFFTGSALGFLAFIIVYFFATALNKLSQQTIFDPIALGIFAFAFLLTSAVGIELSKDLESQ